MSTEIITNPETISGLTDLTFPQLSAFISDLYQDGIGLELIVRSPKFDKPIMIVRDGIPIIKSEAYHYFRFSELQKLVELKRTGLSDPDLDIILQAQNILGGQILRDNGYGGTKK